MARQNGDEATARQRFTEAERLLQESLKLKIKQGDKLLEATTLGQLSRLYLLIGELDKAEAYAHQSREIRERHGLIRELPRNYYNLAQIARARGDEAQAAQWEAKLDEVQAELTPPCPGRQCGRRRPA